MADINALVPPSDEKKTLSPADNALINKLRQNVQDLQTQLDAAHLEVSVKSDIINGLERQLTHLTGINTALSSKIANLEGEIELRRMKEMMGMSTNPPSSLVNEDRTESSLPLEKEGDLSTSSLVPTTSRDTAIREFSPADLHRQITFSGGKTARKTANRRARLYGSIGSDPDQWQGKPDDVLKDVSEDLRHCNSGLRYTARKLRDKKARAGLDRSALILSYQAVKLQINSLQSSWATLPPDF